jgi:hypothetical protein
VEVISAGLEVKIQVLQNVGNQQDLQPDPDIALHQIPKASCP